MRWPLRLTGTAHPRPLTQKDIAMLDTELTCTRPGPIRLREIALLLLRNATRRPVMALVALLPLVSWGQAAPVGDVTLAWTPSQASSNVVLYVLRSSPTATGPSTNWPVVTNVAGTVTQVTVRITPGERFFVVQSSNLWGYSPPSNVTNTPPLPTSPNLQITGAQ